MMKLKEAVKLLGACDTKRWTIVRVTREQTVAEHQYRVWVLSMSLYDHLTDGTPHNSFEREAVGFWALVHDADEIWTGDLPSSIKALIEGISPGTLKRLKVQVLADNLPQISASMHGLENTYAATVVKIAECVEAFTYYREHSSPRSKQREEVLAFLHGKLWTGLDQATMKYKSSGFSDLGRQWVDKALDLL